MPTLQNIIQTPLKQNHSNANNDHKLKLIQQNLTISDKRKVYPEKQKKKGNVERYRNNTRQFMLVFLQKKTINKSQKVLE